MRESSKVIGLSLLDNSDTVQFYFWSSKIFSAYVITKDLLIYSIMI